MAAQPADTISTQRLRTTSAILGGIVCPVVGAKTFPLNRRPESSPNGSCLWTRKLSSGSIRRALLRTILNSIRGLIRVTGQPALTFSVADVADTLPGKSSQLSTPVTAEIATTAPTEAALTIAPEKIAEALNKRVLPTRQATRDELKAGNTVVVRPAERHQHQLFLSGLKTARGVLVCGSLRRPNRRSG